MDVGSCNLDTLIGGHGSLQVHMDCEWILQAPFAEEVGLLWRHPQLVGGLAYAHCSLFSPAASCSAWTPVERRWLLKAQGFSAINHHYGLLDPKIPY